jgi:uncharacterized protein YbaP (TraB family)
MRRLTLAVGILVALAASAAAEPPACAGRDLLAAMAEADPGRHKAIVSIADKVENGRSILWRIDGPAGVVPSYLLGTAHLSDPRVTTLSPAAETAFRAARVVALENTTVLDPAAASSAYGAALQKMVYADGRTLATVLDRPTWEAVKAASAARGIPGWAIMGWKPWMVAFGLLMYPPCELKRWAAGVAFLDMTLGKRARKAGIPVVDLETVAAQFEGIDAMSEADQIGLLGSLARNDARLVDIQETVIVLYRAGRADLLWAASGALLGSGQGDDAFLASVLANAAFKRNEGMARRAKPLIDAGGAFLAVGALHLVGERGLVRLLREAGYTVTAVP